MIHAFNQQYDRQKIELLNVDEPVFDASAPDALRLLANAMRNDGGQHVCFILHGDYNSIRQFLLTQNFVENLDFINAIMFLNSQTGVPLSSQNVLRMI